MNLILFYKFKITKIRFYYNKIFEAYFFIFLFFYNKNTINAYKLLTIYKFIEI